MEVSIKQAGAKRFNDPGIAAALAGDTDVDGHPGSPEIVKCGKLEPKVPSKPDVAAKSVEYRAAFDVFVSLCASLRWFTKRGTRRMYRCKYIRSISVRSC